MRVCVLGANGFLGRYFLSKHPEWSAVTRDDVDLVNQKDTERFFKENQYDVVIHCAVKGGSMLVPEDGNVTHDNLLMFENVSRVFNGKLLYFSSGAGTRGNPPTDPYGLSKWIIDKRIEHIDNAYTLRIFGRKVVCEYIDGKRIDKVCDLVYKDKKLLSHWAIEFGATYEITDTSELGEPYISQRIKLM